MAHNLCYLQCSRATTFLTTDTRLYVPVVTPSTQDKQVLKIFVSSSFLGVNRLFVLFEDSSVSTRHTEHVLWKTEI